MQAGRMRHRVEIEKLVVLSDKITGGLVKTWQPLATVWAAVEPLRGREFFEAQALQSETTTRIRIRARKGVDAKCRVKHGDTIYNVISVINVRMIGDEMQLMCSSGVDDG